MELVRLNPHPLRGFFEEHGVKQWEIAKLLGCSQQQVSVILRGLKKPSDKVEQGLRKISVEILGGPSK